MVVLITGCAGFIGLNFLEYYVEHHPKDMIIGVDALTYAANESILDFAKNKDNFIFEQASIVEYKRMEQIVQKYCPDIIVNFAAETHVDRSILTPSLFIESNVIGTQYLLELSRKYSIKRFHQVSTDEVYGSLSYSDDNSFDEKSPLKPRNPYAASKAAADMIVLSYYYTYNIPVTISRSSNNYGPYQHSEKFIPSSIINLLRNDRIRIYGDGKNIRDWIYVKDHCAAIDIIIEQGKIGDIYNIGAKNERSNIDVAHYLLKELEKQTSCIQFIQDRVCHDEKYSMNCNKIENELGWTPHVDFQQGIRNTIDWYRRNG